MNQGLNTQLPLFTNTVSYKMSTELLIYIPIFLTIDILAQETCIGGDFVWKFSCAH